VRRERANGAPSARVMWSEPSASQSSMESGVQEASLPPDAGIFGLRQPTGKDRDREHLTQNGLKTTKPGDDRKSAGQDQRPVGPSKASHPRPLALVNPEEASRIPSPWSARRHSGQDADSGDDAVDPRGRQPGRHAHGAPCLPRSHRSWDRRVSHACDNRAPRRRYTCSRASRTARRSGRRSTCIAAH
jgi:hypothetical protein